MDNTGIVIFIIIMVHLLAGFGFILYKLKSKQKHKTWFQWYASYKGYWVIVLFIIWCADYSLPASFIEKPTGIVHE